MIPIRRGVVVSAAERRAGVLDVEVDSGGAIRRALAYTAHTGPVRTGDRVVLNTGAVDLGLGTGGYDFVVAVEGGADVPLATDGHAMKLRYTGVQTVVSPVEEAHAEALDAFDGLGGARVVLSGLHSMVPAVAIGARVARPRARIAYVMTDAAALPLAVSDTVAAMKDAGLIDVTITAGQAFGGDLEAVNAYSAIAAAQCVARANVIVAGMGPGNLGTGSRLGTTFLDQAALADAVAALGGEPVVVPRLSTADARERHRGLSHHTATVAELIQGTWTLVVPALDGDVRTLVEPQLDAVCARAGARCTAVVIDDERLGGALARSPVALRTMGRGYGDDPLPFLAAGAAGLYAAAAPAERSAQE